VKKHCSNRYQYRYPYRRYFGSEISITAKAISTHL